MSNNENEEINNEEEENEEGNEIDDDEEQEKNNSDENRMNKENIGKAELIADYKDKENIYNLIIKNNDELKNKINLTNDKYNEILKRIEEKQNADVEQQLKNKINAIEKEIEAYQTENKNFKKKIDQLKNSVYFKNSVANASLLKNILKQEQLKNKEYDTELKTLKRIEKFNNHLISKNEEDFKIKENISSLEKQIKEVKENIKQMNDDYNRLERYLKLVHEKIVGLDLIKIKKKKENIEIKKEEEKKSFTNQEVKDILQLIITLRNQIFEKRAKLSNINLEGEEKMHKFFSQNKSIEIELKEELRIYKDLANKKNGLKKLINKLNGKNKQKIKKQDSVKNITLNNLDLEKSNNNNDEINPHLLNDKNNSDINIDQNDLSKNDNNNKKEDDIINENKLNSENLNEIKENENIEMKEPEEKIFDKENVENITINNNDNKNIDKNENDQ